MKDKISLHHTLVEVNDSVLIVIDVQECFLAKLPSEERALLVNRIGWLISVATRLNVPIIVTAEEIPKLGSVVPAIADRLPPETFVFNKMVFGLAEDHEIIAAVRDTGRNTAILAHCSPCLLNSEACSATG